jgi:hypothetical protein
MLIIAKAIEFGVLGLLHFHNAGFRLHNHQCVMGLRRVLTALSLQGRWRKEKDAEE